MRKTEAEIVEEIRRASVDIDMLLFKNPVGQDKLTKVKYGLMRGASDMIGIQRVLITPDMVGKHLGVFCAVEVKKSDWKPSMDTPKHHAEQSNFIEQVKKMGGKGGFFTSKEAFLECTQ